MSLDILPWLRCAYCNARCRGSIYCDDCGRLVQAIGDAKAELARRKRAGEVALDAAPATPEEEA